MSEAQTRAADDVPTYPYHKDAQVGYGINPPRPQASKVHSPHKHRPWPGAATMVLGGLVLILAGGLAVALAQIHALSVRQSQTTRDVGQISRAVGQSTTANGGSVATLRGQISALQTQANAASHYGVCLQVLMDNNGYIRAVNLSSPFIGNNGNPQCSQGVFDSVVPVPGS
jgi:hypothetical protein